MSANEKVISAERVINAPAGTIFELIADPARQPEWDGNDNLAEAEQGQRVHAVGDVFTVTLTKGTPRPNRVVAFEEGRMIAWRPAPPGEPEPGHEWRWELEPVAGGTLVRHVYDWTNLTDAKRTDKARSTTSEHLAASITRLAALAEASA
jgi:uncharacterized protein YndB with AHSA1/START domain